MLKKELLVFLAITVCLFLLSTQSSFSQVDKEPFPEISDEDLELLEEFLEQAQDLFEVESYEEAISYYDKVLAIDSTDIDALNGKALALDSIGKPEEAISYYDKVLAISSSNIEALNGKALALYNIGKSEEAITYYDRVLAIDSIDDDALFGKALALESLGREAEAIPLLEKFLEENPPAFEIREPPGAVNQEGVEEIAESDQTLFVIIAVIIFILISIIAIDFILRRRKTASYIETPTEMKQTISKTPSSKSDSKQKEDEYYRTPKVASTNIEVNQAIKVLRNLDDMNMLDDPKTAKQFLLSKGFSPNAVKNAMLGMGIDSSHVADL